MSDERTYPHLRIGRAEPVTPRRVGGNPQPKRPIDVPAHARSLRASIDAVTQAPAPTSGFDPRRLLKLEYKGDLRDLARAFPGLEVVSQEGKTLTVVFATDAALAIFRQRVDMLEVSGKPKYEQTLWSITAIDIWSRADRCGRALAAALPVGEQVRIDVELWPLEDEGESRRLVAAFRSWCTRQQAKILDSRVTASLILFRVSVSPSSLDELMDYRDARTVDLPPRFGFDFRRMSTSISSLVASAPPSFDAPKIAVLDTGIAAAHPLLAAAVGDAQSFTDGAPADDENGHGTHVAGLALYGDVSEVLESGTFAPRVWLLSGRISDPGAGDSADGELIENRIDRATRYFVENYGCRVFMLAFCDKYGVYAGGHVGHFSQFIDELARELDVLFVLPTGNLQPVAAETLARDYPGALLAADARLLEPAPAINALTVGSLARYEQSATAQRFPADPGLRHVARRDEPSPFTRRGPGPRGATKPDLVEHGGNFGVDGPLLQRLGELSLNRNFAGGSLFALDAGSSQAAPKVAHAAARLLEYVPDASPNLLRALLVAHAEVPDACVGILRGDDAKRLSQLVGHGRPRLPASMFSDERCVTLWNEAELADDTCHFYEIPLPPDLIAGPESRRRRISVVLAHMPEVRRTRFDYRCSRLEFRLVRARNLEAVSEIYKKVVKREDGSDAGPTKTLPEPNGVSPSPLLRAGSTVQRATWAIARTNADWSWKKPFVVVTSRPPVWGRNAGRNERYAIVVVIADLSDHPVRLYSQLRAAVEQRVRVQTR